MSPHKGKKYPVETLTSEEVQRLIKACSARSVSGSRNRAMIITIHRSGLRLSEALDLRPKDLDLDNGAIRVLHGKGNKARTIGVDATTCSILAGWLDARKHLIDGVKPSDPVFCTLKCGRVDTSYIRKMFKRLAKKAGIEKRVHAHGLRHTHASELINEGVPLNEISGQLGHSSVATTHRYVNHVNPKQRIDRMRAREWSIDL